MTNPCPFHLAIQVNNLSHARHFYGEILSCKEGRSSESWVDFDFFGHQLVCHLSKRPADDSPATSSNPVDGHEVPIPHFGVVLEMETWRGLADALQNAGIDFIIEPHVRFKGQVGEQATMFLLDPSGNALEFKAFQNVSQQLFAR